MKSKIADPVAGAAHPLIAPSLRRSFRTSRDIACLCVAWAGSACTITTDDYAPETVAASGRADGSTGAPDSDATMGPASPGSGAPGADGADGTPTSPAAPNANADGIPINPQGSVPGLNGGAGNGGSAGAGGAAEADAGTAPGDDPLQGAASAELIGWAAVAGRGVDTTTGGSLGSVVNATSAGDLVELAASSEPLTIQISGTLDVAELVLTSNKTLVGVGSDATLRGGILIAGTAGSFVSNVIVSNLNVAAATSTAEGDAIQVRFAHHVWIDHCALLDAPDGLLDIVHGSDFVTVSSTRFSYTDAAPDPAHRFANLTGHDAFNGLEDRGHLNVTWHHNFWSDGVSQAAFGRFGRMHVFNNLFRSPGNASVISAGLASSWLIENNHFEDVVTPFSIVAQSGASVVARANVFVRTSGAQDTAGAAFAPPYAYALEPPLGLDARVIAGAGPR
jgi:pectate lyase